MRPEKASRIVRCTIELYLNGSCNAIHKPEMLQAVYALQAKQSIWHKEHGYPKSDYQPNVETDYENVNDEMWYISDRFNAPQRLAWLAVGIEENIF